MRTIKVPRSSNGERRTLFINNFKGVDYASSPLDVAQSRAVEMSNLHLDDGILRKRNGAKRVDYEQIAILDATSAWGMRIYLLATGEVVFVGERNRYGFPLPDCIGYNIKIYNDKAYVFTSRGIYVFSYENGSVVQAEAPDATYVPTISIGGGVNERGIAHDSINLNQTHYYTQDVDSTREWSLAKETEIQWAETASDTIDDKYLVTYYVKVGENGLSELGEFITFPLVGRYCFGGVSLDLTPSVSAGYKLVTSQTVKTLYRGISGGEIQNGAYVDLDAVAVSYNGDKETETVIYERAGYFVREGVEKCYVLIREDFVAKYSAQIDSQFGIEKAVFSGRHLVTYATYKLWESFSTSKISAVFGSEANENRLFLANENLVFYSDVNNFSYFPEENVIQCGAKGSPITAMCKISDGTLAVMKEDYSGDKSIYYISYNLQSNTVAGIDVVTERFTAKAGATGFGAVNDRCFVNFADDYVFLTDKGLYAIVSNANISTDIRYMRERSRTINPKLLRSDLRAACCYVFKNKLFISDGERTYIADARYRYTVEADMDDTYNYEWFVWDVGAKVFFEINGALAYVSTDGKAYVFTDTFYDSEAYFIGEGVISDVDSDGFYAVSVTERDKFVVGNVLHGSEDNVITEVKQSESGDVLIKLQYPNVVNDYSYVETFTPVTSEWHSPYYDLGASYYVKTLKAVGVGVEPDIQSEMKFIYKTSAKRAERVVDYGEGLDFTNLSFYDFTFTVNDFARNNVWAVRNRNVNYVCFAIVSSAPKDSAFNNVTFEYEIIKKLRGVR